LNDSNRGAGFQFEKILVLVSAITVTFSVLFVLSALQVLSQNKVWFWSDYFGDRICKFLFWAS